MGSSDNDFDIILLNMYNDPENTKNSLPTPSLYLKHYDTIYIMKMNIYHLFVSRAKQFITHKYNMMYNDLISHKTLSNSKLFWYLWTYKIKMFKLNTNAICYICDTRDILNININNMKNYRNTLLTSLQNTCSQIITKDLPDNIQEIIVNMVNNTHT